MLPQVSLSRVKNIMKRFLAPILGFVAVALNFEQLSLAVDTEQSIIFSRNSGDWSAASTWVGNVVPAAGRRVLIRSGHRVVYDILSDEAIRGITVSGTLAFATDRDTRLDVGLINIQAGNEYSESGFDCDMHFEAHDAGKDRSTLEVGTPDQPVDARHTALIRLVHFDGMDKDSCPAIVCCGGQMDFHGAAMNRTWVKLGRSVAKRDLQVKLAEAVTGWRVGDRVIVTGTVRQHKPSKTFLPSVRESSQTEERTIVAIEGDTLTLDQPLSFDHQGDGEYRAEVANLSRNVTVESADPQVARGHTMYHVGSRGSISYAEFRHLGKEGVLGRYSLHFHLVGDTMRGSSVIGASIWDSGNRWLTIHGTNYLVVRDCVGYRSVGHGFFMEDGSEVMNVLDRNLAVQAFIGKPLPKQVIPFDKNDGSGFWWANSLNTFTRNVACDCDEYGYFFQAAKTPDFDPLLQILQPDGSHRWVDIRTLPFVRFEDNEAHCQRRHAFNLGGGAPFGEPNVGGVGPDAEHPFVIRNMKVWNSHWSIHPISPSVMLDHFDVYDADYGVWRPAYNRHAYHDVSIDKVPPANRYAFVSGPPSSASGDFPAPLTPVDDLPPATVMTHVSPAGVDRLLVRGTTSDNGQILHVTVNGHHVKQLAPNYAQWEVILDAPRDGNLTAAATDGAGNTEQTPHVKLVDDR